MGNRPTDWHVLDLDDDPTPGDPERVKQLARELHDFADDVADALRQIKGMAGEDALLRWAGKTAKAFQDEFDEVPKNLKKLQRSYDLAGDALAAYWPKLERAQSLADKALAKGREAQSDLTAASGRLDAANSWVERATKKTEEYDGKEGREKPDESEVRAATRNATDAKSARASAQTAVDNAQGGLEAAKKMAADAKKMREDAASEAKDKLEEASDAGIQNRKWWEKAVDWVKDNWDTIVNVCKVIVAVLGIVVLIIGGPLAWVVLAAALVVLADTLYKYMNGQASLWDVAFAALDCIPGMKGLTTLGGLAKMAKGGMKAMAGLRAMKAGVLGLAKRGGDMLGDAAQGARNRLRNVVNKLTDPVDLATGEMYLTQTDVELPGLLPLTFNRRLGSSYRCGLWFGPTWTSTVDQRLEIDEDGIVFITEDGRLLAYPHPHGTDEVLPESGPRWTLARLETGDYTITDPLTGHIRHFHAPVSDDVALLHRISDRNGHTLTFAYDADGVPTDIRHSSGYRLRLTAEGDRVTALHLANAAGDGSDVEVKRFGYDTDGNLTEDYNSSGLPLTFAYDDRLRVTSWTDRNDRSYSYTYDEHDRCTAEGGEAGHVALTLAYGGEDPAWPACTVTALTTADGATTRFVVNDNSQVVAEIDALGHVSRTEYDRHHNLLSETNALGHTTRYENNSLGQPTAITHPDGSVVRYEYDESACHTATLMPDGTAWRWEYDARGNLVSQTDPSGATTRLTRDDGGRLTGRIDALGHTTRVRCVPAGMPEEVADPLGAVMRFRYDAFGRTSHVTDPTGVNESLTWSVEGHLVRRTRAGGPAETWTYDPEGNCLTQVGADGSTTRFEYTHFDMLSARVEPDGARHEFTYDAGLRLTEVRNPQGQSWHYRFDPAGRMVAEEDFDGRTLTSTFDAAGQLVARTNAAGETVTFGYDPAGRIAHKTVGELTTVYAYDPAGRLRSAANPQSSLVYLRDAMGRVVAETVDGRTTTYEHDLLGQRTRRTTPTGLTTHYAYDAAGRGTSVTTNGHTTDLVFDAAGRETERHLGALTVNSAWDSAGRLARQSVTAGPERRIAQQRSYAYAPDGNLAGLDDRLNGDHRFGLDAVGRVTSVTAPGWAESYAYDSLGNLTHGTWPTGNGHDAALGERTYTATTLTAAGSYRFRHDAAGRLVTRTRKRLSKSPETWHFEYDAEDRLTGARTPDGVRWAYRYDPLGRRTAKQKFTGDGRGVAEETVFTWDGPVLIEQTSTGGPFPQPVTLTWNHQGLVPITQTERITDATTQDEIDARFFAIVTDLVGTPRELLTPEGDIAWRTHTTLWGTLSWPSGSTAHTPLRFPGQYADPETGFHYNLFRYYDPANARYTTPDPLGLAPAPNPAAYVHNPHTWTDPYGLAPYIHASVASSDWGNKGAHVHIGSREVRVFPDGAGGVGGEPIRLSNGNVASPRDVERVLEEIRVNPKMREDLIAKASSARASMNAGEYGTKVNRALEIHFLIKALEKM
ncbi:DUF6531 domain-containing protein [Streptomyces sp. CNQ-509]|uniref:DUF6531 domain-containing protein n=1 Tax=Streptomyces sp. CNQ-509 TaxID=444103 RepID=UPI00099B9329|nr:DUF6531 domain-containing protein [Streptomyces sp. CNQ-509]